LGKEGKLNLSDFREKQEKDKYLGNLTARDNENAPSNEQPKTEAFMGF
jgi:hypothetical protein